MSSFEINKLKISTLPIFKVPDEYCKLDRDFKAVLIISLSSFFSSLEPIISKPTWSLIIESLLLFDFL